MRNLNLSNKLNNLKPMPLKPNKMGLLKHANKSSYKYFFYETEGFNT